MKLLQRFTRRSKFLQKPTEKILSSYFSSLKELGSIIPSHASELERELITHELSDWANISLGRDYQHPLEKIPEEVIEEYANIEDKLGQFLLQREDKKEMMTVLSQLITSFKTGAINTERDYHHLKEFLRTAQVEDGLSYEWNSKVDFEKVSTSAQRAINLADSYVDNPTETLSEQDINDIKRIKKKFKGIKNKTKRIDKRVSKLIGATGIRYKGKLDLGLIADAMFEGEYALQERKPAPFMKVQRDIARKRLEKAYSKYGEVSEYDLTPKEAAQRTLDVLVPEGEVYSPLSVLGMTTRYIEEIMDVPDDAWITENPTSKKPMLSSLALKVNSILWNPNDLSLNDRKSHIQNRYNEAKQYITKGSNLIVDCL